MRETGARTMKKTIATIVLGLSLALPGWASEKMPNIDKEGVVNMNIYERNIMRLHLHNDKNKCSYNAFFRICDEEIDKPFAVYRHKNKRLYLDYEPDGIADKIIENGGDTKLERYVPTCKISL